MGRFIKSRCKAEFDRRRRFIKPETDLLNPQNSFIKPKNEFNKPEKLFKKCFFSNVRRGPGGKKSAQGRFLKSFVDNTKLAPPLFGKHVATNFTCFLPIRASSSATPTTLCFRIYKFLPWRIVEVRNQGFVDTCSDVSPNANSSFFVEETHFYKMVLNCFRRGVLVGIG